MKKVLSGLLISLILTMFYCGVVLAADTCSVQSSLTLTDYISELTSGNDTNKIRINYEVYSNGIASSIGVESIKIYKDNGSYVTTIWGNTSNGLIRTNSSVHLGTYDYTVSTDGAYYAEVTVFARIGTNYDSRTVTTSTITLTLP